MMNDSHVTDKIMSIENGSLLYPKTFASVSLANVNRWIVASNLRDIADYCTKLYKNGP